MRLDGSLEILGFIGHRGLMSWHRMKQAGIPFEKENGKVFSTTEAVAAWWQHEQARRHQWSVDQAKTKLVKGRAVRQRIAHGLPS